MSIAGSFEAARFGRGETRTREPRVFATGRVRPELTDSYAKLLLFLLAGLAVGGKSFAYLGIPPLFVTEIVLALGLVALFRTKCLLGALATIPSFILAILLLWVVVRTVPFLSRWGVDALRDSVLIVYGVFALIVIALLLQKPERLAWAMQFLCRLAGIYVFVGPVVALLQFVTNLSFLPGPAGATVRPDELGVHLSACAVLVLLGFRHVRFPWLCALLFGIAFVASQTRGGLLAILVPVAIATPFSRRRRQLAGVACVGIFLLWVGYAADLGISKEDGAVDNNDRNMTVRQAVDNMTSMVVSGKAQQDGTKEWREAWWRYIASYTLHGRYFWSGKGFGVNLAEDDGFAVGGLDVPLLRSPHSCHMNILARSGVPGLTLWGGLLLSWLGMLFSAAFQAHRRGHTAWRNLLVFSVCYWTASLIDASFDVAMEGPMIGVWFWCQTGFGIAVALIYRASVAEAAGELERRVAHGEIQFHPARVGGIAA